jgi:hypothetical protein
LVSPFVRLLVRGEDDVLTLYPCNLSCSHPKCLSLFMCFVIILGQFPPGWDIGLVGMCVGERRRLTVPPVLAYGSAGLPRRGIPPDATLQYDVTLVSLNGLATPQ